MVVAPYHHKPLMSENFVNNSIKNSLKEGKTSNSEGLSPVRCPVGMQRKRGCYQDTTRKKWSKEQIKEAIICYMWSKEEVRGYR